MPLIFLSATSSFSPEEAWTMAFNELSWRIRPSFVRPEAYQCALAYVQGLMSSVERKNGWQVAEAMGEATPYAIQHLLGRARWNCGGVRDALRAYVVHTLAAPNAVLVVDETGFLKKRHQISGRATTI